MTAWRWPLPHEVLGFIVVLAYGAAQVPGLLPHGSKIEMIDQLVMGVSALLGIGVAAKYSPPHVQEVLAEHDKQVKAAMAAAAPAPLPPVEPEVKS